MKNSIFLLVIISLFVLNSCGLNISVGKDAKVSIKTIDGTQYVFANQSKAKNVRLFLYRNKTFTNKISFTGLNERIEKELSLIDFEKKLDKRYEDIIGIDSISFNLNKQHNQIDLIYYLRLEDRLQKVVFDLDRKKNNWEFN